MIPTWELTANQTGSECSDVKNSISGFTRPNYSVISTDLTTICEKWRRARDLQTEMVFHFDNIGEDYHCYHTGGSSPGSKTGLARFKMHGKGPLILWGLNSVSLLSQWKWLHSLTIIVRSNFCFNIFGSQISLPLVKNNFIVKVPYSCMLWSLMKLSEKLFDTEKLIHFSSFVKVIIPHKV